MTNMFTGCRSLQSIDGLSNWQVNNVEDLSYMFAWCVSLGDISPVSDWTVGTNKLKNMFLDCPITKMQFGEGWIGELDAGNNSGSHHYTTSAVERDHLVSIGWLYEDFGWYGVK